MSTIDKGFLLLWLMRSYLELDMYMSLIVHTKSMIAAGWAEILVFEELLHVTITLYFCINVHALFWYWFQDYEVMNPDKNWNFLKAHMHNHVFDDIKNKGATTQNPMRRPTDRWKPFTYSILTLRMLHPRYLYIYDLPTWLWLCFFFFFFTDIEMQWDRSCHYDYSCKDWPTW